MTRPARIVVFDSGLGGLTVFPAVRRIAGAAALIYVADDAVFPYGGLGEAAVLVRVEAVMAALIAAHRPEIVVIACNTVSTLVLPQLRARWPDVAFVGTVPAIKPAAAASRSGLISVLATPGTVARDYTHTLIDAYAAGCSVTLVGARRLATLAERVMRAEPVVDEDLRAEIAPAFVEREGRRTDTVVLACTHYPLVLSRLEAVAPWPVTWIDPAPAIARRVGRLLDERKPMPADLPPTGPAPVLLTSNTPPGPPLTAFLAARGLRWEPSLAFAGLPDRSSLPDGAGLPDSSGLPDKSPAA
ncbi:glutamate racemase [Lichenihabitans sp. Uapishka_5]|nr:glutamate racemase [Lichenihabitans sp. Uapishka_5]MDX7953015.1 glutamate racemase [Lichenihabitans sp. Uapishka_5]